MGLSRRQFTKEFKLAAMRRLETGASIAEVARAFEVNPTIEKQRLSHPGDNPSFLDALADKARRSKRSGGG